MDERSQSGMDVIPAPSSAKSNITAHIPPEDGSSYLAIQPDEIMRKILAPLEMRDRANATMVCRRWYNLLLNGEVPLEQVVVFNIFERFIWEDSIIKSNSHIKAISVGGIENFHSVAYHIRSVSSVKIWFYSEGFAKQVIDAIAEMGLRMKCIDLYPYNKVLVHDYVFEKLPATEGLTLRPHGRKYFWKGFTLREFPAFRNLTTLVLDNHNLSRDLEFPPTLTTLEFSNRNDRAWKRLMPKLSTLRDLEYLSISHQCMDTRHDFSDLLDGICERKLPKLSYLILKFCRLPPMILEEINISDCSMNLKMLKLDLCYGQLNSVVHLFSKISPKLSLLSLNVISDIHSVSDVGVLAELLKRKKIWLHFGVLQKEELKDQNLSPFIDFPIPISLYEVVSKFEASFVNDTHLLDALLMRMPLKICQEVRFIQCSAANDEVLAQLAKNAPILKRLNVINCENTNEQGIREFVPHMDHRVSKHLEIIWKRHKHFNKLQTFYLELIGPYKEMLSGMQSRYTTMQLSDDSDKGQTVTIWDDRRKNTLAVKDFTDIDTCRIVGVVIDYQMEDIHFSDSGDSAE